MRIKRVINLIVLLTLSVILLCGCNIVPQNTPKPTDFDENEKVVFDIGENAFSNSLSCLFYIPESYDEKTPMDVLVMLHGGLQTASSFRDITKMNDTAEKYGFAVLYIEQSMKANRQLYWNWFTMYNQMRDRGDNSKIIDCVEEIKESFNVNNLFVAGFSAGGCQSVNIAVCYPDIFKGSVCVAGVPYKSALTATEAWDVMEKGVADTILENNSKIATETIEKYNITKRKMLVIQGDSDSTVYKINGEQTIEQFNIINDYLDDGERNNSIKENNQEELSFNGETTLIKNYYNRDKDIVTRYISVGGNGHRWVNSEELSYNEEIVKFLRIGN